MAEPFQFHTEYNLPMLLGIKAKNIHELLDNIKKIPDASVYYHTHRFLQQHHYLIPEPPNDFAYWIRNVLNLRELGEIVASINIASIKSIAKVREKLISTIESFKKKDEFTINCNKGDEFQFMSCKTFCLPLDCYASNLKEFYDIMKTISLQTFYYHIFETQLRLGKERNDFAEWFYQLGYTELADKISKLDPYTTTLEGLREDILKYIITYDTN